MNTIYGTISLNGAFRPTGRTLWGAKTSATRTGRNTVATRSQHGYTVDIVARKEHGQWQDQ